MLKKMMIMAMLSLMAGYAFAVVEVNSADQAALDSIAGLGPATSRAIIAERQKNGSYRDWNDLSERVKGLGERNIVKLSAAGLVVNGKPHAPAAEQGKGKVKAKGEGSAVMKASEPAASHEGAGARQ